MHLLDSREVGMVSAILVALLVTGGFLLKGPVRDRVREIQRAEPIAKNRPLWVVVLEDLDLVDYPAVPEPVELQTGPPPPLPQPKLFFAIALRPPDDAYEASFAMLSGRARRMYEAGETDIEQGLKKAALTP